MAGENTKTYQELNHNRRPERYGREALGKDAHERDTSRGSRTSSHQELELTSDFYHKWKFYNNNKRQHKQEDKEPVKRPHVENKQDVPLTQVQQNNKSSIVIGKTNNTRPLYNQQQSTPDTRQQGLAEENLHTHKSKKTSTTTLDLNITRRPLSQVHNLEPKKLIIKKSNIQSTPANTSTKTNESISKSSNQPTPIGQIALIIKESALPTPITNSEDFEDINEEELPMIGDISSSNSTQPSMKSQETSSIPEVNLLIEGIVTPSVVRTTHNTIETAGYQMGSTRNESQKPSLEETTITVQGPIEGEQDIEMFNQEQESVEDTEVTITSILEEINRSISSKNSSIQEVTQAAGETIEEQSTPDPKGLAGENNNQPTSRIESTPDPKGLAGENNIQPTSRIEALLSEAMLQESNSNELIIPRDEFTFISDPDSLEDIVIYEMVVVYQVTSANRGRRCNRD